MADIRFHLEADLEPRGQPRVQRLKWRTGGHAYSFYLVRVGWSVGWRDGHVSEGVLLTACTVKDGCAAGSQGVLFSGMEELEYRERLM